MLRGPYHFFQADIDPVAQAEYFIRTVKGMDDNGELPPVLDLETNNGTSKEEIIASVKIWLDLVEQGLGRKPIIYSGKYILQDYLSEASGEPPTWAKDYPLWLAQYTGDYSNDLQPFLPKGWSNWTFWQYTESGTVDGIYTSAYINVFNGSLLSLQMIATNKRAQGIDVSLWEAVIDWPKVKNAGIDFVFIKATDGNHGTNPTFDANWRGSKSVGILRSPYHFFRANVDPIAQAEYFIRTVKAMGDTGELPLFWIWKQMMGNQKKKSLPM